MNKQTIIKLIKLILPQNFLLIQFSTFNHTKGRNTKLQIKQIKIIDKKQIKNKNTINICSH